MEKHLTTEDKRSCPAKQMTFGEAVRYLQGGFEEPVQRAIANHVQFCNACSQELERVRALRMTGGKLLSPTNESDNNDSTDDLLPDAVIAAYLDGGLSDSEHEAVTSQIADRYENYLRFSAIQADRDTAIAPEMAAPPHLAEALKVAVWQPVATWKTSWSNLADRIAAELSSLVALKWPAPAMAFAVGVVLMLIALPAGETVLTMPGLQGNVDAGHIRSGIEMDDAPTYVSIPVQRGQKLAFAWRPVDTIEGVRYRVDVSDVDGLPVMDTIELDESRVSISVRSLAEDVTYNVSVMAILPNGGLMPVSLQSFRLTF